MDCLYDYIQECGTPEQVMALGHQLQVHEYYVRTCLNWRCHLCKRTSLRWLNVMDFEGCDGDHFKLSEPRRYCDVCMDSVSNDIRLSPINTQFYKRWTVNSMAGKVYTLEELRCDLLWEQRLFYSVKRSRVKRARNLIENS